MGVFSWPFVSKAKLDSLKGELDEVRATLNNSWQLKEMVFGDSKTTVTKNNALTLSAVYASLNILADTLNIPINVYKRDGDLKYIVGPEDAYEFQCNYLLSTSPSQLYTPSQWIKAMEFSRNIYGAAYSYIIRRPDGLPTALRFIDPTKVEVDFDGVRRWYTVRGDDAQIVINRAPLWDMIHLEGGYGGKGPIDWAMESLSFGKATQHTGTEYFDDGMTNKVILSHPGTLGEVAQKNLRETFDDQKKKGNTVVLEEGLKPYLLQLTPEQSQFIESMEFSINDVARWFNIPAFMLGNSDPTYSNMETQSLHFVTHNVRPRVRMYEQELNWKLLGNAEDYYVKFNMDALLRADLKTRYDSYSIAIANRFMNPNEVRSLENMNPYDGGDKYENPNTTSGANETNTEDNGTGEDTAE